MGSPESRAAARAMSETRGLDTPADLRIIWDIPRPPRERVERREVSRHVQPDGRIVEIVFEPLAEDPEEKRRILREHEGES